MSTTYPTDLQRGVPQHPVRVGARAHSSADRLGPVEPAEPDRALLHRQAATPQPLAQQTLHRPDAPELLIELGHPALRPRLPARVRGGAPHEAEEETPALA